VTNNPVDIAVSQLERLSGYLMRSGRMHALRLSRFVLAAALAFMLSSAQAQAPLSTFKDCDACPEWWRCRQASS
jgi:hypothetical protein